MLKRLGLGILMAGMMMPLHAEDLKPYLQPKVFTGPHSEKMTMVFLEPKETHRVLIRFENFADTDWNNKVILHIKKGNSDKEIYQSKDMSRPTVEIRPDQGVEVRPKGAKADVQMISWSGNLDDVHPYELINAYNTQQTSPAATK